MECTGIAAVIYNESGDILTLFHNKRGNTSLPTGTIDLGYTAQATLIKEMQEELGIYVKTYRLLDIYEHSFDDVQYKTAIYVVESYDMELYNKEPERHSNLEFNSIETLSGPLYNDPVLARAIQLLSIEKETLDSNGFRTIYEDEIKSLEKLNPVKAKNKSFNPKPSKEYPGWYHIPGYPEYYLANRNGELMNIKTKRVTQGSLNDKGYRRVCMWDNDKGKKKEYKSHRLICSAFHGPCPSHSHEVGHKDDDRSNNVPSNLHWTTRKDNMDRVHNKPRKSKSMKQSTLESEAIELRIQEMVDEEQAKEDQYDLIVESLKLESLASRLSYLSQVDTAVSIESSSPYMSIMTDGLLTGDSLSQESFKQMTNRIVDAIIRAIRTVYEKIKKFFEWIGRTIKTRLSRKKQNIVRKLRQDRNERMKVNVDVLSSGITDTREELKRDIEVIQYEREAIDDVIEAIESVDILSGEIDYKDRSGITIHGNTDDLAKDTSNVVWDQMTSSPDWVEDDLEVMDCSEVLDKVELLDKSFEGQEELSNKIIDLNERRSKLAEKMDKLRKSGSEFKLSERAYDVVKSQSISISSQKLARMIKTQDQLMDSILNQETIEI